MTNTQPVTTRDDYVAKGLLRRDDLGDLSVYTYTDRCTHARAWDEITRNSRGHIFNRRTGECVAWTFPKFFNLGENEETQESVLPWSDGYSVFEKVDGWLGNLYRVDGGYAIASRGSFSSPGAMWATDFLASHCNLSWLPDEVTLVFELVSPATRIIVDYHEREALVLLAAFDRHTGREYPWHRTLSFAMLIGCETPMEYVPNIAQCRRVLDGCSGKEMEGVVVRFNNGLRVKIKGEDYRRRSKVREGITPLTVWGSMRNGKLRDEYRDLVEDEYQAELDVIVCRLEDWYGAIYAEIEADYYSIRHAGIPRKQFAEAARSVRHSKVMFACLDARPDLIDKYIMGLIRPHGNSMEPKP